MSNSVNPPTIEFAPFMPSEKELMMLNDWSHASGEMVELTPEGIAQHRLSTAAYVSGELAAYCAITIVYSEDTTETIELGGLVVNPDMRKLRIGSSVVTEVARQAHESFSPSLILAFGNEKSGPLFLRLGGTVRDPDSLPSEVWKLCNVCPRQQAACAMGKRCCDRIFDITDIPV